MNIMNEIEGMVEAFKQAKLVFLTTFSDGKERTRPMTNFNEDPYQTMWFPTDRNTQKVKDITGNPRVLISFPCPEPGCFYEIEGEAEFEKQSIVDKKWEWWWLSWRPHQRSRFHFQREKSDPNRVIINIHPKSVKIVNKN